MKKKEKLERTLIRQVCKKCDRVFYNERIQKYCTDKCRREANILRSQLRYDKLRRAYLESQTLDIRREAIKK